MSLLIINITLSKDIRKDRKLVKDIIGLMQFHFVKILVVVVMLIILKFMTGSFKMPF